jgi:hypothetical protein
MSTTNQHGSGFYTLDITDQNNCKSISTTLLSITCTVVINELLQSSFNIYWNPNNGTFKVSAEISTLNVFELKLFSAIGQLVYSSTIQAVANKIGKEFSIGNSAASVYIIQLSVDKKPYYKKLIIE